MIRRTRRRLAKPINVQVFALESREMMTVMPTPAFTARPMFEVAPYVANPTPPPGAFTPSQVAAAYRFSSIDFNGVRGDGTGQTIAIVDAYHNPNIQADLDVFNTRFGLPATSITQVNQTGGTAYPAADSTGGWALETALDVEWAHAMAPGARILLVEANSPNDADLMAAVDYAAAHASVVSMSWGGGEWSGEGVYDSRFARPGVVFVASSGDSGAPISWPASSPNVLAVGGTSLKLATGGGYGSEAGWSGSGGGPSAYETRPAYQSGVVTQTTMRANPDVALNASPATGFAVYNSYNYNGVSRGWMTIGGTSAGAPQWASLIAIADQGRALNGQAPLNASNAQEVLTTLYRNPGAFRDVTTGTSTGTPNYSAGTGYDYVTGLGTPLADAVVASFVTTTQAAATPDTLAVTTTSTGPTAGSSFSVTVTAKSSSGATDSAYRGKVHFSSTDTKGVLPADYTFTAADAGTHTFTVTLKTAGAQSVTVSDTASSVTTGKLTGLTVSPAAATSLTIAPFSSATSGTSAKIRVTAWDAYGNTATGYRGVVHFTSSDPNASLPADFTYLPGSAGTGQFTVVFRTVGTQSLTVTDGAGLTVTRSGIVVSPAAPTNLTASASSTSRIDLAWTAASGASSYLIQRSLDGATWTQIASVAGTSTTYQDSGLSAGVTYYYRIQASGGSTSSAYSNTASATTPTTNPGPLVVRNAVVAGPLAGPANTVTIPTSTATTREVRTRSPRGVVVVAGSYPSRRTVSQAAAPASVTSRSLWGAADGF